MAIRDTRRLAILLAGVIAAAALVLGLTAEASAAGDVGTADNPIRLSAESGGAAELEVLADALSDATGFEFVVEVVDDGGDAVGWMCGAYPSSSMRIMGSAEFVFANETCGADTRLSLIRFGSSTFAVQFLVPDGSGLMALGDLDGLDWYYGNKELFTGYVVPLGMLNLAGVSGNANVEVGSHAATVQAVYDNSVSGAPPPIFGSTFVDARTLGGLPADVNDEVRVLVESPPIPNNPVAFGPDFPAQTRADIEDALESIADPSSPDHSSWEDSLEELYGATGLGDVTPSDFAFLNTVLDAGGLFDWGSGSFGDDDGSVFEGDIEWMAAEGITKGCNPPTNDMFCPDNSVTRGQMAAFLVRALDLSDSLDDPFIDDDDSIFEADIEKLAAAGITRGCNPPTNDRFCPDSRVTREQMAAVLVRAIGYVDDGGGDLFVDDDESIFEGDIDRLGTAGVTKGCNPPTNDRFCPSSVVTRGQMAAFLHRALT